MVNKSKKVDPRSWDKWNASGAVINKSKIKENDYISKIYAKLNRNGSLENTGVGYEVKVEIPGNSPNVFCYDGIKIRGQYVEGFKHYLSDSELWMDGQDSGTIEGKLEKGKRVTIRDSNGDIIEVGSGEKRTLACDLEVLAVTEVDIEGMNSDPYVAGIDRPILDPRSPSSKYWN